jgi:ubiquinone/menaquinone biosynthesis C-methylase UbiE
VAEIYDRTRSLPNDVMEKLVRTLTRALSSCKSVLDIGVGTGRFAKPLQDAGFGLLELTSRRK